MRGLAFATYAELVAAGSMIDCLAAAAKEARESADPKRKIIHIAVVADMDPSTIWRFEHGNWPRNADEIIAAYATELELDPREIWARAIELWLANEPSSAELANRAAAAASAASKGKRQSTPRSPRGHRAKANQKAND